MEPEPYISRSEPTQKAPQKEANGTEPEKVGFLPAKGSQPDARSGSRSGSRACGPCSSLSSCRSLVCTVLTCGLYRVCQRVPCLAAGEASQDEPRKEEAEASDLDETGFYSDVRIHGVEVDMTDFEEERIVYTPPKSTMDTSFWDRSGSLCVSDPLDEDWGHTDGDVDVDSLINQKLLEVFTQFEIDELARCTSDSMFMKRSREISQLISDIVLEHKLEERDAETRLVREIIRLSTRKSKKRPPIKRLETPPDSGNDTMRGTFSTDRNGNHPEDFDIQISRETSYDKQARLMRANGEISYSPTSLSPRSPSYRDTETDSSGVPLLYRHIST